MAKAKKQTPQETPMRPGGRGGRIRTGNPGNKGGTGRPPDEFKRRMVAIASSDEALAYLEACVKGEHGPKAAASAREFATERGYGKVPNEIRAEVSGKLMIVSALPVAVDAD